MVILYGRGIHMRTVATAAGVLILMVSRPLAGVRFQPPATLVTRWAGEAAAVDAGVDAWVNATPIVMPGAVGGHSSARVSDGTLHPAGNVLAIHAHKTRTTCYIDAGVVDVVESGR
jgi:hypothetical protein